MIARTRTYRIDRPERTPRQGFAHHNEEQRQPPPGHAERIAALEERVAREMAEQGERAEQTRRRSQAIQVQRTRAVREPPLTPLRRRAVEFLANSGGLAESSAIGTLLGLLTKGRLSTLLNHAWFETRRRRGGRQDRLRKGGGSLCSLVTLTPAGWREAERLADPTPKGG